ncbi:hypothetical protein [Embleya sp. NPDC005971]|uniref:hypothetical protein n=1 Tax=Embleya sp. NPDC005971 TaxID=3156724 RepID=UPI0033E5213C
MSDSPMQPYVNLDRPQSLPAPEPRYESVREPLAAEGASPAALAQEVEALNPTGYLRTELAGTVDGETVVHEVVALMPGKWKASTMRVLQQGDMDAFMAAILTPDSLDAYFDLDPDQDQIGDFMADLSAKAGESVGKSGGRRKSVTRMRRK